MGVLKPGSDRQRGVDMYTWQGDEHSRDCDAACDVGICATVAHACSAAYAPPAPSHEPGWYAGCAAQQQLNFP